MHRKIGLVAVVALAVAIATMAGRAADKNRDWPAYAGDKGSTKYSPLDQINKDTIKNLKIAWRRSGHAGGAARDCFRTPRRRPTTSTRR